MQKPLLFLAALFCSFLSYATNVSGLISSNTTWTKANSPYIVTGDIDVDTGATLTIEPGVQVRFDGNYFLKIDGMIIAKGTALDSISFTYNKFNPTNTSWKAVAISHKNTLDTFIFDYCHFQYSNIALGVDYNTPVVVTNSCFENNTTAITSNAYLYVSHSRFTNNYTAISANSASIVTYNDIGYSYTGYIGDSPDLSNNIIHHCTIGIKGGKNVLHNTIAYCYIGIFISGTVMYNQLWHCTKAVLYGGGPFSVQHNGLKYNDTGILVNGYLPSGLIRYNCIENSSKIAFINYAGNTDVSSNYWGETDSAKIAAMVYDFYDEFICGKVLFTPVLQSADSGCADSITIPTAIKTVQDNKDISVYPNPIGNSFTINVPNTQTIKEVRVYDLMGKELIHTAANSNKILIDASSLSTGIYLYRVSLSDNSIVTGKVLKE